MLVLTRKVNERIVLEGVGEILVCRIGPGAVRLGLEIDKSINIRRAELPEQTQRGKQDG